MNSLVLIAVHDLDVENKFGKYREIYHLQQEISPTFAKQITKESLPVTDVIMSKPNFKF